MSFLRWDPVNGLGNLPKGLLSWPIAQTPPHKPEKVGVQHHSASQRVRASLTLSKQPSSGFDGFLSLGGCGTHFGSFTVECTAFHIRSIKYLLEAGTCLCVAWSQIFSAGFCYRACVLARDTQREKERERK